MVNSVYFGLSTRVNNIEEAVFFLGLRQIRELSMATPVIEELEKLCAVFELLRRKHSGPPKSKSSTPTPKVDINSANF